MRVESTRVIDLVQFTDETAIDPIYVDRAYYLAPDGPMAAEAFAVMREGMEGKAGIGKVALYGREYLVAVRPQKKGLVMYTLHHAPRSAASIRSRSSRVPAKVKPEEMKLAKQVIETFEGELNLKDYKDEYQEGLRKIIDAKIAGEEIVAPEVQEPPKVVNLMDALRKSLDAVSAEKKKPAKADMIEAGRAKAKARTGAKKGKCQGAERLNPFFDPSRRRSREDQPARFPHPVDISRELHRLQAVVEERRAEHPHQAVAQRRHAGVAERRRQRSQQQEQHEAAAARSGPVTVRTPHDATRDCFSISDPIVCRRSI